MESRFLIVFFRLALPYLFLAPLVVYTTYLAWSSYAGSDGDSTSVHTGEVASEFYRQFFAALYDLKLVLPEIWVAFEFHLSIDAFAYFSAVVDGLQHAPAYFVRTSRSNS